MTAAVKIQLNGMVVRSGECRVSITTEAFSESHAPDCAHEAEITQEPHINLKKPDGRWKSSNEVRKEAALIRGRLPEEGA